jgi:hypothetical protein
MSAGYVETRAEGPSRPEGGEQGLDWAPAPSGSGMAASPRAVHARITGGGRDPRPNVSGRPSGAPGTT